ncbi:hypothetical protein H311_01432 [Anncaliia algerae PRA109]|nr:hypothetical protein H311_01432 [Anncaliia algerae PRA109]
MYNFVTIITNRIYERILRTKISIYIKKPIKLNKSLYVVTIQIKMRNLHKLNKRFFAVDSSVPFYLNLSCLFLNTFINNRLIIILLHFQIITSNYFKTHVKD